MELKCCTKQQNQSVQISPYCLFQGQADEKYVEVDEREKVPHYEQRKWEEEQMSSAVFRFGARDKAEKNRDKGQEYELVLDDEIEFIQALRMPGSRTDQEVCYEQDISSRTWLVLLSV